MKGAKWPATVGDNTGWGLIWPMGSLQQLLDRQQISPILYV